MLVAKDTDDILTSGLRPGLSTEFGSKWSLKSLRGQQKLIHLAAKFYTLI